MYYSHYNILGEGSKTEALKPAQGHISTYWPNQFLNADFLFLYPFCLPGICYISSKARTVTQGKFVSKFKSVMCT